MKAAMSQPAKPGSIRLTGATGDTENIINGRDIAYEMTTNYHLLHTAYIRLINADIFLTSLTHCNIISLQLCMSLRMKSLELILTIDTVTHQY